MSTCEEIEIQIHENDYLRDSEKKILALLNDYIQGEDEFLSFNVNEIAIRLDLNPLNVKLSLLILERKSLIKTNVRSKETLLVTLNYPFLHEFLNDGELYYV